MKETVQASLPLLSLRRLQSILGDGRSAVVLIFAILVSSCSMVGPDFTQPAAKSEPQWLESGDKRIKSGAANYRNWWAVFNDPVLERLIELAYRQNLSLRAAGARVLLARAELGFAIGELYPQSQQAIGALQQVQVSRTSPFGAIRKSFDYAQSQAGLAASWEIDFWGKFRRAIESADANLFAAVADYDNTLVSLTADVATVYITIRTLEKRLAIALANIDIQSYGLRLASDRYDVGTTSKRDVEQARSVLASTQATVPTFKAQLRQAKNALSVLLGMPPSHLTGLLQGVKAIPAPPPQVVLGIPADLLRRRPDVLRAESLAAAQCARIGVAKSYLYPAFSLTGSFGFEASNVGSFALSDIFLWKSRAGNIGPSVRWNLFNYGQITNRVRVADARFQELLITYQNTVLKAQQDVEDHLIAFLKAEDRAGFLAVSAAAALESKDLAFLQYKVGTVDFTTVLVAQQALLTAQEELTKTLGDISRNLVGVYRALGGGWQIREGNDWIPAAIKKKMAQRTNWGTLLAPADPMLAPVRVRSLVRTPKW